jgi:FKBP-type peptidyl-prolyl cis-trans isomerase FkpA
MKTKITGILASVIILGLVGCDNVSYKKTKSGLAYKIIPGNSKDSVAKLGNIVKFHFVRKLNDSVLVTSFDKMPSYMPLQEMPANAYSPIEVFFMARKGDSIVTVESIDTLLNRGMANQLPPNVKKGDQFTTYIKILEVFKSDSLAMPDYQAEVEKDKPRREKEMKEQQVKDEAERKVQMVSGVKEMETYLAAKKITAQKTEEGTFVVVKEKGTGEPVVDGKFITVKYTGKLLETDSVFESNQYEFQMPNGVIRGWIDGLKLFNKGGKGTLYIPGFMAYGKDPGPGNKPYTALIFDVEVMNVSDKSAQAPAAPVPPQPAAN